MYAKMFKASTVFKATLENPDPAVRVAGAAALGQHGMAIHRDVLLELGRKDSECIVQSVALRAASSCTKEPNSLPPEIEAAARKRSHSSMSSQ